MTWGFNMNTKELIESVEKNLRGKVPSSVIKSVVTEVFTVTQKQIKRGDKLVLKGFGTFQKVKRKARAGTHPGTGDKIKIKAYSTVKFSPSTNWKSSLNPKRK